MQDVRFTDKNSCGNTHLWRLGVFLWLNLFCRLSGISFIFPAQIQLRWLGAELTCLHTCCRWSSSCTTTPTRMTVTWTSVQISFTLRISDLCKKSFKTGDFCPIILFLIGIKNILSAVWWLRRAPCSRTLGTEAKKKKKKSPQMTLFCVRFEPGVLTFQSQSREGLQCQRVTCPGPAARNCMIHLKAKPDDATKPCLRWMNQCNRPT